MKRLLAAACLAAATLTVTPTPARAATVTPTKVLTVIEENHSLSQAKAGMPYLMGLANTYAYSSAWSAIRHPSEPNYVAIVGGSTFGITTDNEPVPSSKVGAAASVFGQAISAGRTAHSYQESLSKHCAATSGSQPSKHNPWVFFGAEAASCKVYDTSSANFLADATANTLPNAGLLVPTLANDAHDGSLATADSWLKARLPTVLASSDFTSGRLTVVVTFDEGTASDNHVLTVVMNAGMTTHGAVSTPMNHYALTGYYDHVLGTPLLRSATTPMAAAYGLR